MGDADPDCKTLKPHLLYSSQSPATPNEIKMKYLKNENRWSLTPDAQLDVRDALPAGNYTVCQNPLTKEY